MVILDFCYALKFLINFLCWHFFSDRVRKYPINEWTLYLYKDNITEHFDGIKKSSVILWYEYQLLVAKHLLI